MAEHPTAPANGPRYEVRDAKAWSIVKFGIGLAVVAAIIHLTLAWLFGVFEKRDVNRGVPVSQVSEPQQGPPAPKLQVNPYGDLESLRQHEQQALTTYGWADKSAGHVHIPIDRAMDLIAQRGIPPTTAPAEGKRQTQPVGHPTAGSASETSPPLERNPQ